MYIAVSHILPLSILATCSYSHIYSSMPLNLRYMHFSADRWRVILKGEQPDYINAVYINVMLAIILYNVDTSESDT